MGVTIKKKMDASLAIIKNPAEALIREAQSYLQVRELPGNNNRSVRIDYWNLESIGSWEQFPMGGKGAPWCASFVTGVGRQALGHAWPIIKTASAQAMVDWAKQKGVWHEEDPKKGDVFALYYPNLDPPRHGHVGIVVDVSGQTITTVEGNTNEGGSREGYGVFNRVRTFDDRYGFIRWIDALNS